MLDQTQKEEDMEGYVILLRDVVYWFLNGKLHRTAGPAVVYPDGDVRWRINGKSLTEEEFNERRKGW